MSQLLASVCVCVCLFIVTKRMYNPCVRIRNMLRFSLFFLPILHSEFKTSVLGLHLQQLVHWTAPR